MTTDIIHQAPWRDWCATQDTARGVLFCNRAGDEEVKVEPPPEWGRQRRWNLTEDGSGIYFRKEYPRLGNDRTAQTSRQIPVWDRPVKSRENEILMGFPDRNEQFAGKHRRQRT